MREWFEDCAFWLAALALAAIVAGWWGFAVVVGLLVLLLVEELWLRK